MLRIQIVETPSRRADLQSVLELAHAMTVGEILRHLGVASQGVITAVDDEFVDESFLVDQECELRIVSAVSGG